MSRFVNKATGVTFSVSDDKDDRYTLTAHDLLSAFSWHLA